MFSNFIEDKKNFVDINTSLNATLSFHKLSTTFLNFSNAQKLSNQGKLFSMLGCLAIY